MIAFPRPLRSATFSALSFVLLAPLLLAAAVRLLPAQTPTQGPAAVSATPTAIPARITAPVDDNVRVPLAGTVHPLTHKAADRGLLPDSTPLARIELVLKRSDAQEASLRQLIDDLHNPGSPAFHKWLTPDQFGQQFGPSDADIAAISTWLTGKGFTVTRVNPGRQTLEFAGNAGQFRSAFHAELHHYAVAGEAAGALHVANTADPQIPAALAPVFGGFMSLNNFALRSHLRTRGTATYNPVTHAATPNWTITQNGATSYVLAPADFSVQYDLNPLYTAGTNGAGQTIAIINESNIDVYLANQFRSTFNLPANPPQVVIDGSDPGVDGVNNPDGMNYASIEAYLDVEWAGAVAPQATVDLVIAADTYLSSGLFLAAQHAVYSNLAPIMSLSFGECEANLGSTNQFISGLWQQAAAQGITVMVSTGDSGSAGCDDPDAQAYAVAGQAINGLGSTPYNVAVGGTDFYYSAYSSSANALNAQIATYWNTTPSNTAATVSIKGVIPEQPWNGSQYGLDIENYYASYGTTTIAGGSGGASTCSLSTYATTYPYAQVCTPYAKPSWQTGPGVPADKVRDTPDVSLFAASGENLSYFPICAVSGDCQPSSTLIQITGVGGTSASAPSFAGIMALVDQKYGRQGQADYTLYSLAQQYPAAFHDVTVGTDSVPCLYTSITYPQYLTADNCIAVANPLTVTDYDYGTAVEGAIGAGTTREYNATAGYDLASGIGTVDANVLLADWNKLSFNATTTTLTPSATTFNHGTAVTVTGSVKNTAGAAPTGSVALMSTSILPNNQGQDVFTLASGSFSGSLATLPGGTYTVYGHYGGDPANSASTSTPVTLTVTPEASTNDFLGVYESQTAYKLLAAGVMLPYGTSMTLEALPAPTAQAANLLTCIESGTVACPVFTEPTGTMNFTDSSTSLGTVTLTASGEAAYTYIPAVGAHSVAGAFSGDASYNASTSAATAFTVSKDAPYLYGYSDTLATGGGAATVLSLIVDSTAAISSLATAPTGTLTLSGGPAGTPTTAVLTPGLDPGYGNPEGIATIVLPASTPAGTYTLTFSYPGDTNYSAAAATKVTFTIVAPSATLLPSTTSAVAATTSVTPASPVVLTVTVAGQAGHPAPTGAIDIITNGYYLYQGTLPASSTSSVTFQLSLNNYALAPGANNLIVEYLGDKVYQPSTSTAVVNNALADFTLVASTPVLNTGSASATETFNLASVNGFAGAVSLSCSSAASITCSFSPASVTLAARGVATDTLTVVSSKLAATGSYTVLVTGADATGQFVHTVSLTVNVTSLNTLTLSSAGNITIPTQGASGTTTLTVAAGASFSGAVNLACSLASSPTGAVFPPACTVTTPVTLAGLGTANSTLTVTTTPQTRSALVRTQTEWLAALGGTAFTALLGCLLLPLHGRSQRRLRKLGAGFTLLLLTGALLGTLSGCGGSGSSAGGALGTYSGGTTLGAYTFNVTATDAATGKITASTVVSVSVN